MSKTDGLENLRTQAVGVGTNDTDVDTLYKMFILLYADETVIFGETPTQLQSATDAMHDYCYRWDLTINVSKTKVIIFSRGKVRRLPKFFFNGKEIETVFDFKYLGIKFNYNGKFNVAQNDLYNRATKAMFALMKKNKKTSVTN